MGGKMFRQSAGLLALFPMLLPLSLGTSYNPTTTTNAEFGLTRLMIARINYTWTINNLNVILERIQNGLFVQSSQFTPPEAPGYRFTMRMYPSGVDKNKSKEMVGLYANYESGYSPDINVDARFRFRKNNGESLDRGSRSVKNKNVKRGYLVGWHDFSTHSWIKDPANQVLSSSNQITVLIDLTMYLGHNKESGHCRTVFRESAAESLSWHMDRFLQSPKFIDMTLLVKDSKIQTHKVVLAARSPIIKALIEEAEEKLGKELTQPIVAIDNIEPDIMTEVLRYIYTGQVSNLATKTLKLLHAANQLELVGLKQMCEKQLCSNMKMDNAYEMLRESIKYNANGLKTRAAKFIAAHFQEMSRMPNPMWHQMGNSGCISSGLAGH